MKAWQESNFNLKYLVMYKHFYTMFSSLQLSPYNLKLNLFRIKHKVPE